MTYFHPSWLKEGDVYIRAHGDIRAHGGWPKLVTYKGRSGHVAMSMKSIGTSFELTDENWWAELFDELWKDNPIIKVTNAAGHVLWLSEESQKGLGL